MHSSDVHSPVASLDQLCTGLPAGACRLVLSDRVDELLAGLTSLGPAQLQGRRLFVIAWDQLPAHSALLEEVLDRIADAALLIWPDWYRPEAMMLAPDVTGEETADSELLSTQPTEVKGSVMPRWLGLAENAAQAGLRPRFKRQFTAETEVRQLSLALGSHSAQFVLAVRELSPDSAALTGLARTAEWLLRETQRPILVIVPTSTGTASELDSISFDTVIHHGISTASQTGLPTAGSTRRSPSNSGSFSETRRPPPSEDVIRDEPLLDGFNRSVPDPVVPDPETGARDYSPGPLSNVPPPGSSHVRPSARLYVHPLIGRPHPDSRGEQLLWSRLAADETLRGMFECNVWVSTTSKSTYLVDFVWRDGRVIVEIDGYYWHSSQFQFSFDRRRDYELLLSGFSVMRIPHDELLSDLSLAVENIRRLVQLKQSEGK